MSIIEIMLGAVIGLLVIAILLILFKKTGGSPQSFLSKFDTLGANLEKVGALIREESLSNRREFQTSSKDAREELGISLLNNRQELTAALKAFQDQFSLNLGEFKQLQRQNFGDFSLQQDQLKRETEGKLEAIRIAVETNLQSLREDNAKKLEEMRVTVDEKLQSSVEKRFSESFKLISDRLDQVHQGLGEMQNLAIGVGDLKKVLTNVKTRGNLGEIQLGAILEQILSQDQYEQNAVIKLGSQERVEYVIKLPGRNDNDKCCLLPIDSKFPNEDYQRLLEAYENVANLDPKILEQVSKQFESSIKRNAKNIFEKYIDPPTTTDFAIMFVPTEGLYAEILRRVGLFEILQREYKITVVGPTNLSAFLSSLHMGFRTLAIEKRSSQVWEILGAIKNQFGKFGDVLDKTKKKLQQAADTIEDAGRKSRSIEKKLRDVQELPEVEAIGLLEELVEFELDPFDEGIISED